MRSSTVHPELQPPIFVIEGLDVSLYPAIDAAILDLEGIDVADGAYRLFDAHGRRITLRTEGVRRSGWTIDIGTVHFDRAESVPTGVDELTTVLAEYCLAVDLPCDPQADLATLVQLVRERHRI